MRKSLLLILLIAGLLASGLTVSTAIAQTAGAWGSPGKIVKGFLANGVGLVDAYNIEWGPEPGGSSDTFTSLVDHLSSASFPWTDPDNLNDAGPSDIADADLMLIADASDSFSAEKVSIGALRAEMQEGIPSGGQTAAQVDALIRAHTGQTVSSGQFALDRIPAIPAQDVTVVATGFDGNLPTTADTAQKVAQAIDDLTLRPGGDITGVTAGAGLTGGGTSGAITLAVANPFTDADETKLDGIAAGANDYNLPRDLAAFSNDLSGNGYEIQSDAVSQTHDSGPPVNSATAATYTYGDFAITGLQVLNNWWYVRVRTADEANNLALYEVRIGSSDDDPEDLFQRIRLDGTDLPTNVRVERRGTNGAYTYFGVFLPDKPAANAVILTRHDRLTIGNVDIPYNLLLDAPPLNQIHPYPASITALPARPWRRGIWYWNDSGGTLAYAGVEDYTLHTASGIGLELRLPADDPKVQEIVFYSPSYSGSSPPAAQVAGKATVLIKSGGTTANIFNQVTVNGIDYTVQSGAVISSGGLQFLIDGLTFAHAVTLPNHPAGTVSFGARRRNGNFLIAGGHAATGLIMWDGDEWRQLLTPEHTNQ